MAGLLTENLIWSAVDWAEHWQEQAKLSTAKSLSLSLYPSCCAIVEASLCLARSHPSWLFIISTKSFHFHRGKSRHSFEKTSKHMIQILVGESGRMSSLWVPNTANSELSCHCTRQWSKLYISDPRTAVRSRPSFYSTPLGSDKIICTPQFPAWLFSQCSMSSFYKVDQNGRCPPIPKIQWYLMLSVTLTGRGHDKKLCCTSTMIVQLIGTKYCKYVKRFGLSRVHKILVFSINKTRGYFQFCQNCNTKIRAGTNFLDRVGLPKTYISFNLALANLKQQL